MSFGSGTLSVILPKLRPDEPRGRQAGPADEPVGGSFSGVNAAELLRNGDLVAVDAGNALPAALGSLLA